MSLAWTGWSWTAEDRLSDPGALQATRAVTPTATASATAKADGLDLDVPFLNPDDEIASGV
eukprot:11660159-Ditylum_brightwellii.AAC.1